MAKYSTPLKEPADFPIDRFVKISRPKLHFLTTQRLWAALVQASGGVWAGCVYDVDAIVEAVRKT